jgi:NTE family protein
MAGAGARGAYEAGALAVLLPVLERRGERPTIVVGTSAGAINAVLLASLAHLPAERAGAELVRRWCAIDRSQVIGPLLTTAPGVLLRYAAGVVGARSPSLTGLLDTTPLRRTVADRRWLDFDQLHANVRSGRIAAAGVVATRAVDGRSVVLVEASAERRLPGADELRGIRYSRTRLGPDHVLASSAIPVVFPPVRLDEPPGARAWYVDGGLRLNVPIKPALELGADRVARPAAADADPTGRPPTVTQISGQFMRATLVDRMIEDVRELVRINRLLAAGGGPIRDPHSAGGRPYGLVDFVFVGPAGGHVIAATAGRILRERYSGLRGWLPLPDDFVLIRRALAARGVAGDELMSYLLFDKRFMADLVALGRADALAMLTHKRNPWRATHMPGTPHRHPFDVPSADVREARAAG